jgi:hypothetical protein
VSVAVAVALGPLVGVSSTSVGEALADGLAVALGGTPVAVAVAVAVAVSSAVG